MRTITEILKEADKTNDCAKLITLTREIIETKSGRPNHEFTFALEHIRDKGLEIKNENIINHMMS